MNPIRATLHLAIAVTSLLAIATSAGRADTAVGVNAVVRNQVQTKALSEAALHPAIVRASVHIGDQVVSGDKSALQILLLDRSVFTVGANARMTIDRFVYDPTRGSSDIAASVARGAFRFMSGPSLGGAGQNAINSPVATIGVRGTIVEGVVGPDVQAMLAGQPGIPAFSGNMDSATLVVLRGPGHDNQGFDKPGAIDVTAGGVTVSVEHPGQAVIVWGPGQPPFGPFALSDANFERLSLLLRTRSGDGGPSATNELGDVGSAGANSGQTLNVGAPGDPFATQTSSFDLPIAKPQNRYGTDSPGGH